MLFFSREEPQISGNQSVENRIPRLLLIIIICTRPKITLPTIIIIVRNITLLQDMLYTVLYIKNKYNNKKKNLEVNSSPTTSVVDVRLPPPSLRSAHSIRSIAITLHIASIARILIFWHNKYFKYFDMSNIWKINYLRSVLKWDIDFKTFMHHKIGTYNKGQRKSRGWNRSYAYRIIN